MSDHERLDRAAEAMAAGQRVDFNAAASDVDSAAERRMLRNLELVQRMADLPRDDIDATVDMSDSLQDTSTSLDAAHTTTLQAWGPLNLLERIGRGGFGEVYRAWDTRLNRSVAVKLLRPDMAADLATDEERVLDEARLLARVEHPNVARIYEVARHGDRAGIAMELIEGTDLRTLVREGTPLGPEDAARLGRDIADALAAIHAADVVHQDIKPNNIVVREDGRVVVMDFGAGRRRRFDSDRGPRLVAGSPITIPPETLLEDAPPSPASDIYAAGCVLYFLLTGRYPAEGSLADICEVHAAGEATPLRERNPEVPAALDRIVEGALAPRDRRTASAAQLKKELDEWLTTQTSAPSRRPWAVAAVVATLATVGIWIWQAPTPLPPLSAQLQMARMVEGERIPLGIESAISADDGVELTLHLTRPGHVYVLNRDGRGDTVLLFPLAGEEDQNPLPAGRPVTLPGMIEGQRMLWRFSKTPGPEDFLVIASATPLTEFERELTQVAALEAGGGLTVRPIDGQILDVAWRGVIGLVEAETTPPDQDLFALADELATGPTQGLWVQRYRLHNTGE